MPASEPAANPSPLHTLKACMLLMAGYALCLQAGFPPWRPAEGLLFAAFWLRPARDWPWLAAAAALSHLLAATGLPAQSGGGPVPHLLGAALMPLPALFGAFLGRRVQVGAGITTARLRDLWLAAAAAALLWALIGLVGFWSAGAGEAAGLALMPPSAVSHFLGALLGIVLVMPVLQWLFESRARADTAAILREGLGWLLPTALLLFAAMRLLDGHAAETYLHQALLVLTLVFSFRHGWRGAALSLFVAGLLIGVDGRLHDGGGDAVPLQSAMLATAALALSFGVRIDGLRGNESVLLADKTRLQEALSALAQSSRRNMGLEEVERKRIAHELHDELGQLLTALQLRLAEFPDNPDVAALELLGARMRRSLGSAVNALSPDELNQIGLYEALCYGSPSQLCELAGIRYQVELQGNGLLLSELQPATALAAYRIVQESVNNAVKYARCRRVAVRLRIGRRGAERRGLLLLLDIRDDGIGVDEAAIRGGFHSIRDRVLALGGAVHIGNREGLRVHALLRQ